MQLQASNYSVLDPKDCLSTYSDIYVSTYSDVILVSSDRNETNSLLAWDIPSGFTSAWLCAPAQGYVDIEAPSGTDTVCDFKSLEDDPSKWTSFGHPVRDCLARAVDLDCSLNLDITLMAIMIVCNALLLAIMVFTLTGMWSTTRQTLTCFGDVLATYLQVEDEYSRGMCLADKARIHRFWQTRGQPTPLHKAARGWYAAMNRGRLTTLMLMLVGGLIAVLIVVAYALYIVHSDRHLSISPYGLYSLGFGSTTTSADLNMNVNSGSVTALAVQANIPQIILAVITLVTNAALVEMTQAAEYASFSKARKPLRVSEPVGAQRGTYLFSMPYKFAIPVQIITAALHWCISQSIIPVKVTSLPTDGSYIDSQDTADLAFSPLAIVASTVMAGVLVIATLSLGLRKLQPPMPLASSCSLALSSAAHPLQGEADLDAPYKAVQWGATGFGIDGAGHTSFTASKRLLPLDERAYYA